MWTAGDGRGNTFTMSSPLQHPERLQLAGMESEAAGLLGTAPFPVGEIVIPTELWLEGSELCYRLESDRYPDEPDGALDAFIRIEEPEDVLRFTSRWGPFHLCAHQMPSSHGNRGTLLPWSQVEELTGDCWPESAVEVQRESTADYLKYVKAARSLVNLSAAVHLGELEAEEDWNIAASVFYAPGWVEKRRHVPDHIVLARNYVALLVSEWIRMAGGFADRLLAAPRAGVQGGSRFVWRPWHAIDECRDQGTWNRDL